MKVKQLSLFLENQPGALNRPTELLAKAGLNILTLSLADTQQYGILRLIVAEWEKAKALLEREGFVVNVTDLVAIEVADQPGGLARVLGALEKTHVNIEYMYGFTLRRERKGLLAFRFNDPDAAIHALQKKGINPVGPVELFSSAAE
jgi:hypothetical protein